MVSYYTLMAIIALLLILSPVITNKYVVSYRRLKRRGDTEEFFIRIVITYLLEGVVIGIILTNFDIHFSWL